MMPGMIMMWHGSVATIPSGWHLCDGTAGTPDWRNKIIIGAGDTYAPGDTFQTNVAADTGITAYAACWIMKLS